MLDATSIDLPKNSAKNYRRPYSCWHDDHCARGSAYSESTSTAYSHSVVKRQKQISPAYHAAVWSLDAGLDSHPGSPGPVESELSTYNTGKVVGSVDGAYTELQTYSTTSPT